MKTTTIITLAAMLLLALSGCEKEPVQNPALCKYKYVVETDAEHTLVKYLDSSKIEKSLYVDSDWQIEWMQTGPRPLYIHASTDGETILLTVRIIKNDTIHTMSSNNTAIKDVFLYSNF